MRMLSPSPGSRESLGGPNPKEVSACPGSPGSWILRHFCPSPHSLREQRALWGVTAGSSSGQES